MQKLLRLELLEHCHDDTAGHLGLQKTWDRVKIRFFWPGIFAFVRKYVPSCVYCQTRNVPTSVEAGLLQAVPLPPTAFQKVSVALTGSLPWSHNRYRYMVVVVDHYSKYAITGLLRSKEADEVAEWFIRSVIFTYSMPRSVLPDLGSEFYNRVLDGIFVIMGIMHIHKTPYNPQSNAQVERNHQKQNKIFPYILRQTIKTEQIFCLLPSLHTIRPSTILTNVSIFYAVLKKTDHARRFNPHNLSFTPL